MQRDKTKLGRTPSILSRQDALIVIGVFLCALAVRLVYLLQYRSCPFFAFESMDAGFHVEWARAIAGGTSFVDGPYFRAPLYPWLLGLLFRAFGENYFAIRFAQMVIGSMSAALVYIVGRQIFSRIISAIAAFAYALYWAAIYFDGELLIPVLAIFLNLLLLLAMLRAGREPTMKRSALAGLLLGLSALARPNILLLAPFFAIWLLTRRLQGRRSLASGVLFLCAVLIPVALVTVRNAVVGKDLVLISSQGGVNFFIGNNPRADGVTIDLPGVEATIPGIYEGSTRIAQQQTGRTLKPSEVSNYYFREALSFFQTDPGRAVGLLVRKTALFWTHLELMNNRNLYFLTEHYAPFVRSLLIGFWLIGPLGILGLAASFRRRGDLFPLWGFVLLYMVSVVLFFVTARYRLPAVPVLLLLGAYGVQETIRTFREGRFLRLSALLAALVVGIGLSIAAPSTTGHEADAWAMIDLARSLREQGKLDQSIDLLEETVNLYPSSAQGFYTLGATYEATGRINQAIDAYAHTVEIDPDHVSGQNNLGALLVRVGRAGDALPHLQRAFGLAPQHLGACLNLGGAYATLGRFSEASEVLERGLVLHPQRPDILVLLAHLCTASEDPTMRNCERGRSAAEEALRLTGGNDAEAIHVLALVYARCGEIDRAIVTAEEALRVARSRGDRETAARIEQSLQTYRALRTKN